MSDEYMNCPDNGHSITSIRYVKYSCKSIRSKVCIHCTMYVACVFLYEKCKRPDFIKHTWIAILLHYIA